MNLVIHSYEGTHSLFLPAFNVRSRPVYDGETVVVSFTPDRAGTFPFQCGVMCGPLHPEMTGKRVVLP